MVNGAGLMGLGLTGLGLIGVGVHHQNSVLLGLVPVGFGRLILPDRFGHLLECVECCVWSV